MKLLGAIFFSLFTVCLSAANATTCYGICSRIERVDYYHRTKDAQDCQTAQLVCKAHGLEATWTEICSEIPQSLYDQGQIQVGCHVSPIRVVSSRPVSGSGWYDSTNRYHDGYREMLKQCPSEAREPSETIEILGGMQFVKIVSEQSSLTKGNYTLNCH